eukprot:6465840-Amphidinium_carterae.1
MSLNELRRTPNGNLLSTPLFHLLLGKAPKDGLAAEPASAFLAAAHAKTELNCCSGMIATSIATQ